MIFVICAVALAAALAAAAAGVYLKHKNGIFFRDLSIHALCISWVLRAVFVRMYFYFYSFFLPHILLFGVFRV